MNLRNTHRHTIAALLTIAAWFPASSAAQQTAAQPETVLVTYHAKPGAEAELARVLARHWDTLRQLKLVLDAPHVVVRGDEGGKTYIVEIATWRDANIPDHAPPAVLAIWEEMRKLVEPRNGRPGIDFVEVAPIAP